MGLSNWIRFPINSCHHHPFHCRLPPPTDPPPPLTIAHHTARIKTWPACKKTQPGQPQHARHINTSATRHKTTQKNNHKQSKAWQTQWERHQGGRVQQAAHTWYACCFLFFYFFSNYILAYHYHSQPPKNEPSCLFLGGMTSHWQPQPPKTRFSTHTPPKTSCCARFRGLDHPLASTTTHTSWKQARLLIFRGWAFLLPAPRNSSFSGGCIEHAHMGVFYVSSVSATSLHLSNTKDTPVRVCLWLRTLPFHWDQACFTCLVTPAPPSTSRTPEMRLFGHAFGVSLVFAPQLSPQTRRPSPSSCLFPLFPLSLPSFSPLSFSPPSSLSLPPLSSLSPSSLSPLSPLSLSSLSPLSPPLPPLSLLLSSSSPLSPLCFPFLSPFPPWSSLAIFKLSVRLARV